MASFPYNSVVRDGLIGNVNYGSDTFKVMLVTSTYTANKDTHTKRSDVTNEVTGTGYTAGGTTATATVAAVDTVNDKVVVTFASVNWPSSTITARGAVYYKSRGGASSADELVYYDDFGSDVTSTGATFTLGSTTITFQN